MREIDVEILTEKEVTAKAVDAWAKTYALGKYGSNPCKPRTWHKEVYERLVDTCATEKKDIDAIIGNDNWTKVTCDECQKNVKAVAVFETSEFPLHLCHDCIVSSANALVMELIK